MLPWKSPNRLQGKGRVLLKNENSALPMAGDEWVSLLPTSSWNAANSNYISGIESGGFTVFSTSTTDPSAYTDADKRSHEASDVAIITIHSVVRAKGDGNALRAARVTPPQA